MHGLLQIPQYALAIMELADSENMFDHEAALAARLERQKILGDHTRQFSFVMLEQVLHAPIVTRAQLEHLAELAIRGDWLTIGIVPHGAPWPAIPWSGYNLYELSDGSQIVTAELTHGESTVTGEDDVKLYADLHSRWLTRAVTGEETAELGRNLADGVADL
ncbi:DUF5753 domain-containing protein [Kribbella sp. CWNU-51]